MNRFCFAVISHAYFHNFIKYLLIVNALLQVTEHYQQPSWLTWVQNIGNTLFTMIFFLQALLKIGVAGPKAYLSIPFHTVESLVVLQSVAEVVWLFVLQYEPSSFLRLFRLLRLLCLIRDAKDLRKLLHTGQGAPGDWEHWRCAHCRFVLFAMVGIAIFQDVRYDLTGNWSFSLRTLPKAMYVLYSVSTLDNWVKWFDCRCTAAVLQRIRGTVASCRSEFVFERLRRQCR